MHKNILNIPMKMYEPQKFLVSSIELKHDSALITIAQSLTFLSYFIFSFILLLDEFSLARFSSLRFVWVISRSAAIVVVAG